MTATDPGHPGVAVSEVIAGGDLADLLLLAQLTTRGTHPALRLTALDTLAVDAALTRALAARADAVVADARAAGASWDKVGQALGVDRSAAHKRFNQRARTTPASESQAETQSSQPS